MNAGEKNWNTQKIHIAGRIFTETYQIKYNHCLQIDELCYGYALRENMQCKQIKDKYKRVDILVCTFGHWCTVLLHNLNDVLNTRIKCIGSRKVGDVDSIVQHQAIRWGKRIRTCFILIDLNNINNQRLIIISESRKPENDQHVQGDIYTSKSNPADMHEGKTSKTNT